MARHNLVFLFCLLITCFSEQSLVFSTTTSSAAHGSSSSCSNFVFPNNHHVFASCTDLPNLHSFLHWTYDPSSTALRIAYRHTQVSSSMWVAWGINPTSNGMVGTQAIVAYQKIDGTMTVFTSPVDSYGTRLVEANLSFPVSDISASFLDDQMILFAVFRLPQNTTTSVNYVWQDGPVSGTTLGMHDVSGNHLRSMGTLNLSSGQASTSHAARNSKTQLRITHAVLNTVSWGIMMPLGFIAARYLKAVGPKADPLWFYVHIILQLPAYFLGMAGGATGLYLGIMSSSVHHPCHMGIGIALFCLGLFQISALFLRPAKDHKYRFLWNWFHHLTGYTVLLLSFANIWVGFYILKPTKAWVIAYGIVSGTIIISTIILEVWKILSQDGNTNGANEDSAREENKG